MNAGDEGRASREPKHVRRQCLVLDTNQWLNHLMLRSPTAAAVLYSLRQQDGVLGLPYVVEEELKRHAVDEGLRARDAVISELDKLRRLLGSAPSPTLPADDVLASAAARRLDELAPLVVRVPFTWEQAQDALRRVLDLVPPNSEKNQQYKDTLIWGAVLALAVDFDVLFVTSDKGFYASRDAAKGLATALLADLDAAALTVVAVDSLAAAAELLRLGEPPVDVQTVIGQVDAEVLEVVEEVTARAEFTVGPLTDSSARVFATENPDVVAVTFTITHALDDLRRPERTSAAVSAEGECVIRDGRVGEFRLDRVSVDWVEATGEVGHAGNVYARASLHLGERHEPYAVRAEIRRDER